MSNFKKFVLNPAISEINAKTDIKIIGYKDKKRGPKIIGFRFDFASLSDKEITERQDREVLQEKYLKTKLKTLG